MSHVSELEPDAIVKSLLKTCSATWCSTLGHAVSSPRTCVRCGVSCQRQQRSGEAVGGERQRGQGSSAASPHRCTLSQQAVPTLPSALLATESYRDKRTFKTQCGCPYCISLLFFFFTDCCTAVFCIGFGALWDCVLVAMSFKSKNTSVDTLLLLPRSFLTPRELTELPL